MYNCFPAQTLLRLVTTHSALWEDVKHWWTHLAARLTACTDPASQELGSDAGTILAVGTECQKANSYDLRLRKKRLLKTQALSANTALALPYQTAGLQSGARQHCLSKRVAKWAAAVVLPPRALSGKKKKSSDRCGVCISRHSPQKLKNYPPLANINQLSQIRALR